MTRCKSCLTKTEVETGICPVCGIEQDKPGKALTPVEKRIRRAARNIRFVAMLHLIGAGIGIMRLPEAQIQIAAAVFSILNFILAIGLIRYDYRAYKLAVVCYFAFGIVSVITIFLWAIPLVLLLLYVIGNRTARDIFERRLPE